MSIPFYIGRGYWHFRGKKIAAFRKTTNNAINNRILDREKPKKGILSCTKNWIFMQKNTFSLFCKKNKGMMRKPILKIAIPPMGKLFCVQ